MSVCVTSLREAVSGTCFYVRVVLGFAAERYVLLCARARRIARARRNTVCVCSALLRTVAHECSRARVYAWSACQVAREHAWSAKSPTHSRRCKTMHSRRLCHLEEISGMQYRLNYRELAHVAKEMAVSLNEVVELMFTRPGEEE